MSKARFLLRRIQAIKNTQKTTYAMKLVAGAKLKKVQALIEGNRLYEAKLLHSLKALNSDQFSSPLFEGKHSEGPVEVLAVVGSSRGLCGALNTNIRRFLHDFLAKKSNPCKLFVIGRKLFEGLQFSKKFPIIDCVEDCPDIPSIKFAQEINKKLIDLFFTDEVGRVTIIYTHFTSVLSPKPAFKLLLPLKLELVDGLQSSDSVLFEPSLAEVADYLIPRLLDTKMLEALLESKCSEQAMRMVAMENATKNAGELAAKLTLIANKLRQSSITSEILDIIGGAEATKKESQF
jgi:F-type H+-transporting ATPase subunit gamma